MSDIMAKILGALIGVVLIGLVTSYPLMILWNECLVPAVPAINKVEWLQMWGITILIGAMCKGS